MTTFAKPGPHAISFSCFSFARFDRPCHIRTFESGRSIRRYPGRPPSVQNGTHLTLDARQNRWERAKSSATSSVGIYGSPGSCKPRASEAWAIVDIFCHGPPATTNQGPSAGPINVRVVFQYVRSIAQHICTSIHTTTYFSDIRSSACLCPASTSPRRASLLRKTRLPDSS